MEKRMMSIRALYTINGQNPYMLARSNSKVEVLVIPQDSSDTPEIIYGKVALRPCLEAICLSSPELAPSGSRDWSVYVFDPFESQQRGCTSPSQAVAVGLGWLSDALRAADSPAIFGTLMCDGIREDGIEVIFSLREGTRIPLPRAHTWSAPSTASSTASEKKTAKRTTGALFTKDPLRWPKQEIDTQELPPTDTPATSTARSSNASERICSDPPIKRSDSAAAESPAPSNASTPASAQPPSESLALAGTSSLDARICPTILSQPSLCRRSPSLVPLRAAKWFRMQTIFQEQCFRSTPGLLQEWI
ncbi:hypothetical protein NUW54_g2406 [Trametes sanguinea]|uniref:Uncharacterized protein n=1 Tax=Trametes sanguinea TaxID=158606 RepID=A0ACC1Q4Z9_9APHY|nr:hypothetical protein NUW54_g2406 [Trametes sanguinea]